MNAAELDVAIGVTRRAFVDTSVCIAYHSQDEVAHPVARHLFQRIEVESDPLVGYLSVIAAAERLVRPKRAARSDLVLMHTFLRRLPNLFIVDVDIEIAHQAANIRALTRLALSDALIVGTAIMAGCQVIVTNDEQWSRRLAPLFPQFTWIFLGR
jgi:predicted nucleic acid-binding protein